MKIIRIVCLMIKSQQRFKSDCHNVCTEQVYKIVLVMMIKDCKHLIRLQHSHMEQMVLKYAKVTS